MLTTKLGKIIGAFRSDGFFSAFKRVSSASYQFLKLFLKRGESGDILFIVGGVGASSMYRGYNVAEELEIHGIKSDVVIQDNPFLIGFAKRFKVFVFHRTTYTDAIRNFIEEIKRQNGEIIFETDDLLYDPKYLENIDYLKNISKLEKELYKDGIGSQILNDPYVKVCTTTTTFLKNKLEDLGKKVFLVPNKINNKELKLVEDILRKKSSKTEKDSVKLGYFSGTMSHNKDFQVIVGALKKLLEEKEDITLCLAGPLEKQGALSNFEDRIEIIPFASRKKNYQNIYNVDVNLLPLEVENPFCEAKSELKFFEAGILGVPTIASNTNVLKEVIDDGENGFLAASEQEWFEKMKKMVEDGDLRRKMGEKAREKSLKEYTNKNSQNEEYYNFIKEKVKTV